MKNDTTMPARRIPVILDTDIGDDIDDTWALAASDDAAARAIGFL